MTPDTEDLLWRRFNEWFRARRPDYPSEWDAYQAGHAAAKAETAAAVAQEPVAWESTKPCYIKYITQARYEKFSPAVRRWYKPYRCSGCAAQQCADAIRAGAKETSDA